MHAMNVFNSHQYCSVESEIRIVRSVFPPQRNVVSLDMVGGQEMRRSGSGGKLLGLDQD